jgi:hypothetical protein
MLHNLEGKSNWGMNQATRLDWAAGLPFEVPWSVPTWAT